jgi:hypothetical protein
LNSFQTVQQVKAFRVSGATIKNGDIFIEKFLNEGICLVEGQRLFFGFQGFSQSPQGDPGPQLRIDFQGAGKNGRGCKYTFPSE